MLSLKLYVCLLLVVVVACVCVSVSASSRSKTTHFVVNADKPAAVKKSHQNVRLTPLKKELDNSLLLEILGLDGSVLLRGHLGMSAPLAVGFISACTPDSGFDDCYSYGDYAKVQVARGSDNCTKFVWTSTYARKIEDCFNLVDGVHWYGGGETYHQAWPIEGIWRNEAPMVTGDSLAGMEYGGVTENYWLVSTGVAIQADEDVPLFISWGSKHEKQVCLSAQDIYPYKRRDPLELKYSVCTGDNLKDVHQKTLPKFYDTPPSGPPDRTMLLQPFWSTWAQYHVDVNQTLVIEYAQRLKSEGFAENSHIEIDDDWENCYGEAQFNTQKFPNVTEMVETLNALDLKVTLWIHPFINFNCPSFQTAIENNYFVKDEKQKPGITSWWQGSTSGLIDFTNEAAATWWKARLEALQVEHKIDSYKFDAGETNWLPHSSRFSGDAALEPNIYTTKYVEALVSFGGMIEVRSGRRNQREPIFTRMLDKDSKWGHDNGLRSLIPTLLHFGIIGYPFVLPDMIGGNAYGERPSKELYIRWMQANAFMPSVQFSIVPWDYDAEVVQICLDILRLRVQYQNFIYEAVDESLVDGTSINRPIWWEDPNDRETLTIDDEYMLGDDILVAPVVHEGNITRNIYLPRGNWVGHDGVTHIGPLTLINYAAPLNVLPYFIKSTSIEKLTQN